jgi:uncharacterized protein
MTSRLAVKNLLKTHGPEISKFGISKIGLFGSLVRNEQTETSDIDILVDFQEGQENFDNFINVCYLLEEIFQRKKVDVVTLNGLSPYIGPLILKEIEYVQITH